MSQTDKKKLKSIGNKEHKNSLKILYTISKPVVSEIFELAVFLGCHVALWLNNYPYCFKPVLYNAVKMLYFSFKFGTHV